METNDKSLMYFREGYGSDKTLSGEGYRRVIEGLHGQGVEVFVVRGNEQFDMKSGMVVPYAVSVERDGDSLHVKTSPADQEMPVGATSIRVYGRDIAPEVEQFGPSVINAAKVRELDEKDKAYEFLGDLQPLTLVVEPDKLKKQLQDIGTDSVVLKPVKSEDSRGRLIVPKQDLLDDNKYKVEVQQDGTTHLLSADGQIDLNLNREHGYLLQELIDTKQPFPSEIANAVISSCKQDYEAHKHDPKEVRLMLYWGDKKLIIPYARLFKPKGDQTVRTRDTEDDDWLLLDTQQHLPPELESMATTIANDILTRAEVNHLHGAVDAAWDGQRWRVMELNMWFPVPPKYSLARQHGAEELADVHRRSIAELMGDAARDANARYKAHIQDREH